MTDSTFEQVAEIISGPYSGLAFFIERSTCIYTRHALRNSNIDLWEYLNYEMFES